MYIAQCYVRVGGKVYVRGECLPKDTPTDRIAWLVKAGAALEVEDPLPPEPENVSCGLPQGDAELPGREENEDIAEQLSCDDDGDADEETEAPEIDVMAGIVRDEESEEPARPAGKAARRRRNEG